MQKHSTVYPDLYENIIIIRSNRDNYTLSFLPSIGNYVLSGLGSRKKVHPNFFLIRWTMNQQACQCLLHHCLPMPASACQNLYIVRYSTYTMTKTEFWFSMTRLSKKLLTSFFCLNKYTVLSLLTFYSTKFSTVSEYPSPWQPHTRWQIPAYSPRGLLTRLSKKVWKFPKFIKKQNVDNFRFLVA